MLKRFNLLLVAGLAPLVAENFPSLSQANLDVLARQFASRPQVMQYKEDVEYVHFTKKGIDELTLLRFQKSEKNGAVSKTFLKGVEHKGSSSAGGLRVYDYQYPFLRTEQPYYDFYRLRADLVLFIPRGDRTNLYTGTLSLRKGLPYKLSFAPQQKLPIFEYYFCEVYFMAQKKSLVEKFIEVHSGLRKLPWRRAGVRYRVQRFDYQW